MNMASLAKWWTTTPTTELVCAVAGNGEGAGQHPSRDVLVFQYGWRRDAARLRHLSAGPRVILGQAAGLVIYARNIYFIWLGKREPSPAEIA